MRRKCEIAKTYHGFNIERLESGRLQHCGQIEDCKRKDKNKCPECTENGVRKWAKMYKKEFERHR